MPCQEKARLQESQVRGSWMQLQFNWKGEISAALRNSSISFISRSSSMLEELEWSSINQLCGEARLIEAWKTVHLEKYCMQDVLSIKKKSQYMSTRSNDTTLLVQSEQNKFSNARFVNMIAKIWNECPKEIKEEPQFEKAKILIKKFCKTLPI